MRISDWSSDVCSSDLIMGNLDFLRDLTGDRTEVPPFDRVFFGNEKGYAGYVQGRYAFDLGGMTVDGLVGLRAVRTETEINGFDRVTEGGETILRSEEHTSELQSLMRISYAVFCLKKKKDKTTTL